MSKCIQIVGKCIQILAKMFPNSGQNASKFCPKCIPTLVKAFPNSFEKCIQNMSNFFFKMNQKSINLKYSQVQSKLTYLYYEQNFDFLIAILAKIHKMCKRAYHFFAEMSLLFGRLANSRIIFFLMIYHDHFLVALPRFPLTREACQT